MFEVSPTLAGGPFRIDDKDEGGKLEKSLHAPIDTIYPGRTYRSPIVADGSTRRELTDVLGFDAHSICVTESKTVSVLTAEPDRSSMRRAAIVMKHVTKALKQLQGAHTKIRSRAEIYDTNGERIALTNRETSPAHAIVLLSEMYAFLDWRSIARQVIEASESARHRALFHVIDLSELTYIVRQSENAEAFNGYMMQRWLHVKINGTAYGRVMKHPNDVS